MISSTRFRNSGRNSAAHFLQHHLLHRFVSRAFEPAAMFQNPRAAHIAGHHHDGVLEIHRAPLPVGQTPIVQHLQHHIEHVVMRLLDLVEQHHRIRPAPHRLGQLPALFVPHVARRRAHQPRHRVLLLVLRHIDADHGPLVVEQKRRQRPRQLRLADARRTQEDEAAHRPLRILQPRARADHRLRHRRHRFVLPDHPLVQFRPPGGAASASRLPSAWTPARRSSGSPPRRCLPRPPLP